jgi:hypothetical protein
VARLEERIDAAAASRELLRGMAALPDGERAVLKLVAISAGRRGMQRLRWGSGR